MWIERMYVWSVPHRCNTFILLQKNIHLWKVARERKAITSDILLRDKVFLIDNAKSRGTLQKQFCFLFTIKNMSCINRRFLFIFLHQVFLLPKIIIIKTTVQFIASPVWNNLDVCCRSMASRYAKQKTYPKDSVPLYSPAKSNTQRVCKQTRERGFISEASKGIRLFGIKSARPFTRPSDCYSVSRLCRALPLCDSLFIISLRSSVLPLPWPIHFSSSSCEKVLKRISQLARG